jgi:tripartite-type tricarboxylate transporter receptor subunit TctC
VVAPFPPGGVADLTARPVAAAMEKVLKNPVGVVNKTGAAGAVGMQFVATSKPDGYTLLLALSSISIIPEADKLFGRPPAFTVDQFAPIALISADPTILVVPADKPWKTARDFVEDAKKRPGQISFSSSGVYGTLHMAMELLSHAAGIKLRHVPYAGGGPLSPPFSAVTWTRSPRGPRWCCRTSSRASCARWPAGGTSGWRCSPSCPRSRSWATRRRSSTSGLGLAPGHAGAGAARLREAARAAVADPDFRSAMDKLETPIAFKQGEEFQKFFEADARRLADGVRKVGRVEQK